MFFEREREKKAAVLLFCTLKEDALKHDFLFEELE